MLVKYMVEASNVFFQCGGEKICLTWPIIMEQTSAVDLSLFTSSLGALTAFSSILYVATNFTTCKWFFVNKLTTLGKCRALSGCFLQFVDLHIVSYT